ncbi:MAG: tripartite tricarboxylate transporter substrate binding protein, partial [Burkholderia sp.]|nr:tripartite tricarboxylate transporter substrate binding protein [Burkholderia sp.]
MFRFRRADRQFPVIANATACPQFPRVAFGGWLALKPVRMVAAALIAFAAGQACAQGYPDRPVRVVVPFPAASATDVLARTIGQKLSEKWHQPVVIDNRPGA